MADDWNMHTTPAKDHFVRSTKTRRKKISDETPFWFVDEK